MQPYRLIVLVARARGSISPRRRIFASETHKNRPILGMSYVLMTFDQWLGTIAPPDESDC